MKVYALVGKSGTGKSHHSMWVAKENKISHIIDDGLLISDNRIIAGRSAKREPNKMASVRCAIFSDEEHTKIVKDAIRDNNVTSLLIIGTSEKMVNHIADVLGVAPIEKIIHIEDVSTPEQMKLAAEIRTKQGKHVIPVPTFEVKKQFSGYFIDPMMLLFKKKGETFAEEKTVIRPTYSYLGDYKISPKAIADICTHDAIKFESVHKILKVKSVGTKGNRLIIDIDLSMNYPCHINTSAKLVAQKVWQSIEEYTSINVKRVNINVKTLHVKSTVKF
ncbi:MAG: Asp23/Gls24 family envelope stress response protein [Oscillospiraceae bacterium]